MLRIGLLENARLITNAVYRCYVSNAAKLGPGERIDSTLQKQRHDREMSDDEYSTLQKQGHDLEMSDDDVDLFAGVE